MKKTRWIILVLTVIICVAVYVNWDMVSNALKNGGGKDQEADKVLGEESFVSDSYFENARYTRKKTRDEAIAVLNTIVSSADSDEDAKKTASDDIGNYALASEKESVIEDVYKRQ